MKRAERRHYTQKWKKKRFINPIYFGHRCNKSKCGICSHHKQLGNNRGRVKSKYYTKYKLDNL